MANINVYLGGHLLPVPDVPFKRSLATSESTNQTLDNTIYTDFSNYRRIWSLQWGRLSATNYDLIMEVFEAQYANEAYPILQIDLYNIYAAVKMSVSDQDIQMDGDCIVDFSITLEEQYAVS